MHTNACTPLWARTSEITKTYRNFYGHPYGNLSPLAPLHHLYSESCLHKFLFDFFLNTKSIFLIYYYLVLHFLSILHAVSKISPEGKRHSYFIENYNLSAITFSVQKSGLKSVSAGNDRMEQSPGSIAQVLTTALSGLYKCHLVRADGKLPQSKWMLKCC